MKTLDTRTLGGAAAQVGGLSGIDIHAATGRRVALGGDCSASGQLRFLHADAGPFAWPARCRPGLDQRGMAPGEGCGGGSRSKSLNAPNSQERIPTTSV